MCLGLVGEVDEDTLAIAQRRDSDQRADGFYVSSGLADETPYVRVRQLDLDRNRAATPLERLHEDVLGLLGESLGDVLHERAIVHGRAGWTVMTLPPGPAAQPP